MSIQNILDEIKLLQKPGFEYKPHKTLLLLAVVDLFDTGYLTDKKIFYDTPLVENFSRRFNEFANSRDRNRPYTPFFHLQSTTFWKLIPKTGQELALESAKTIGGPGKLQELVHYACISDELHETLIDDTKRNIIRKQLVKLLQNSNTNTLNNSHIRENPFISYINSLHSLDSDSSGALAEWQSCQEFFSQLCVPHPLVAEIFSLLHSAGSPHIILTGHAGDGKTTLCLELYKKLLGLSPDKPLSTALKAREEISANGKKIVLVKDLSECSLAEQIDILAAMSSNSARYFLISNSGTLLSLFKNNAESLGSSVMEVEGRLLEAMNSETGSELNFVESRFQVYNLAKRDNLELGMGLWRNLVNAAGWEACRSCSIYNYCPIARNHAIINNYKEIVEKRLFLLLRRITDYGERLTMRQLNAHFAYMLCAGYSCKKMHELYNNRKKPSMGDFLFFNLFFGEGATGKDARASQMRSVQIISEQGFGNSLCSGLERYFWLLEEETAIQPQVKELSAYYERLKKRAVGKEAFQEKDQGGVLSALQARQQVRRIFYFLYEPQNGSRVSNAEFDAFLAAFLASPKLLDYEKWRRKPDVFALDRKILMEQIFPVLQEQFCGIRMPARSSYANKELYISLARKSTDVRQSAQIVLKKLVFDDFFDLLFEKDRIYLVAKKPHDLRLELDLPFLDYIEKRRLGGLGHILQMAYIDRLENLKNQILRLDGSNNEADGLILLKHSALGNHACLRISIAKQRLEVANVKIG